jgi:HEAT repeat protein
MTATTQELCDPRRCSGSEAIRIAKIRSRGDASYEAQITDFLNTQWAAGTVDVPAIERAIEILGAIAPPARLFGVLRIAMSQHDSCVRSKSALALATRTDSLPVLNKLLTDANARVRANTIEALWGRRIPGLAELFQRALTDGNHRVAINAAYALYLLDPVKHLSHVESFVNDPRTRFRMAAAWLVRKIGNPGHLSLLKTLVRDQSADVRRAAFQTLAVLRPATAGVQ